jgi:hypothetical protein
MCGVPSLTSMGQFEALASIRAVLKLLPCPARPRSAAEAASLASLFLILGPIGPIIGAVQRGGS